MGERVALASVRVTMSGGQQGAYCWIKNTFCRRGSTSLLPFIHLLVNVKAARNQFEDGKALNSLSLNRKPSSYHHKYRELELESFLLQGL